ncbi:MAG: metallophosphoesterase family protein, partial [Nocardioidaceae bacterium]
MSRLRRAAALVAAWAAVAFPVAGLTFVASSETTTLAGHSAVVGPTFDRYATFDLGPYLPSVRYPTGHSLGAHIDLGKTDLASYEALVDRYAMIGARPEAEFAKIRRALQDLALRSALVGGLAGLAGPGMWVLVGKKRRSELVGQLTARRVTAAGVGLVVLGLAVTRPWQADAALEEERAWSPVAEELPDVPVPEQAQPLEVEAGLFTSTTRRLAESMLDSYARSVAFYDDVVAAVPDLADEIRTPSDEETVALLVSDRHDNVGMDRVARAIGDAGGASVLLDAGDDTSTGSTWEAFSLDSLARAFDDYEHRYAVSGNHDHGDFVGDYLDDLGFTRFDGESRDGPDGIRLLGADDPRSSGLGSWRDETDLSFSEHAELVADQLCEYDAEDERVSTLLVHDANTGRYALERGCVDLVVGGHVHEQLGPTEFTGE